MKGERETVSRREEPVPHIRLAEVQTVLRAFKRWHFLDDPRAVLNLRTEYEENVTEEGNVLRYGENDSRYVAKILGGKFNETGYMVGMLGACALLQKAASAGERALPNISTTLAEYWERRSQRRKDAPGDNIEECVYFEVTWQKRVATQALAKRMDAARHFIADLPIRGAISKDSAVYGFAEGVYLYEIGSQQSPTIQIDTRRDAEAA